MLHQAILVSTVAAAVAAAPAAAAPAGVTVTIQNPLPAPRTAATIAVNLAEVRRLALALEPSKTIVVDDKGKPVLSQLVDVDGDDAADELVFQADLGARQTRRFDLVVGQRSAPKRDDFKVYGRFVRERHDDFAWENDRIAHRMYGTDLETWRKEPLTSSGIDVWVKRTRKLVVNDWYMMDDYHRDTGEGADLYSVGKTRGCGGSGVWTGDKLAVSRNFATSRVLTNGPIRLVFELGYAPWDAGGVKVSETKRITLDAGSNFDRVDSTYRVVDRHGPPARARRLASTLASASRTTTNPACSSTSAPAGCERGSRSRTTAATWAAASSSAPASSGRRRRPTTF